MAKEDKIEKEVLDTTVSNAAKVKLINSEEFDKALAEGAECKKDMMVSYKTQNKQNFTRFSEVMIEANEEVKKLLETKKKNRSDDDNKQIEDFKRDIRQMYAQVQALCVDEHLEEDKKTRIEKIVDKVIPVIDMLRYIDEKKLDDAFAKHGVTLASTKKLEDKIPALDDDNKREVMKDIFKTAIALKQKMLDDDIYIIEDIFASKVPTGLQFDKGTNNIGLKTGDWRKLVDAKAKLIMAKDDEAKEKAEEKIEHLASEKQFEAARAELVRDKLTKLQ